jgi:hypothetical protein
MIEKHNRNRESRRENQQPAQKRLRRGTPGPQREQHAEQPREGARRDSRRHTRTATEL